VLTKKMPKLLVKLLVFLMFITNPTCLITAHAAVSTDNTETIKDQVTSTNTIAVDKSAKRQEGTGLTAKDDKKLSQQEKTIQFSNGLLNYYLQNGKRKGPNWLKNTDLSVNYTQDYKLLYSLETLQPLSQANDHGILWFWQGRYNHNADDPTINLGAGWRNISSDKTSMIGLNAFYDYSFQYQLARIGLGAEYFNDLAEYRFNVYHPVSGDKLINSIAESTGLRNTYIRVVQGLNYEMGTAFKHMPWMKLFIGGFYWDNEYNLTEEGYRARTTLLVSPRVQLELGYNHSNLMHNAYGQVTYNLIEYLGPAAKGSRAVN
jgi:hypothetical protein